MWSGGLTQNLADNHVNVVSMSVFVAVLCLCIVIGHLLEENRWVNESITAILIGCLTGTIILLWSKGTNSHIVRFNEELFFIYLLPPIIFNAGFLVKKKQFFRNFITIMLFGVVGVFISSAIIAAGIGTIFSSTDTVCTLQVLNQDETPLLYSIVFGEGVVNDATSVVLFNAVRELDISKLDVWAAVYVFGDFLYLFLASTVLGVATGLLTAYAFKSLYFGRHSTDREIALMVLMAYLSYMLAELLQLSGILTVFFCGIVMSHYAWYNVTENSRITTRHIFATMSFIAETFIFLYVGMDSIDIEKWKMSKTSFKTSVGICCTLIFLILLGRAAFVFPLSALSNYMNRRAERTPITFKHQIVIWWAGLMRGAVSIALAFSQFTFSGITWNPVHATMVTSTVIVVLFTTLVFGFLTKPLINVLLPHHAMENNHHQDPDSHNDELKVPLRNFEESSSTNFSRAESLSMLIERPVYTIHFYWRKFDNAYMRPIFGGPCR
ncbi:sodium/hydrogen exchanger 4-like isoform X2 [Telopea speciosissima]|uniref:sodium/hydrogen exchanger 4-like isoform X2 n=1 Tax=Telopea speciosissima TaxID=54955 RepID=UPI001CC7D2FC|nr:sodium/hydrogen exchanger 4-like isoform X2 [Telopea speciosissima]